MALISIANLRYSYGDHHVLDGVNLTLAEGEHVGLVGRNGCGKSTLLKLIRAVSVGEPIKHDDGQIQVARGATVGYLDQHHGLDPAKTLREEAMGAFADLHALHDQLEQTAHAMGDAGDDPDELDRLMKRYADLEHRIDAAGGFVVEHKVEETLHGLGLTDEFFDVKCGDLSGGQRGRLALARLLLAQPDVLLLDEPTNHLDIAGRQWLEEFLRGYGGAVLLISHDRWLLDHVVSKIYELEEGELVEYPGNYAKFRELRAARIEEMRRAYDKQQTKIKSEQAFIDRYKAGQRAKQARGRETRLERFKRDHLIELPPELDTMKLSFSPKQRSGDVVLAAERLGKGYEGKPLFDDVTVTLKRGERLGVIGPNGAGKSTIVRCLLGEQDADAGTAKLGASLNVGYYRQSHDGLDLSLTVVEYLRRLVPSGTEQEARDLAGAFLFSGGAQDKPLSVLSGGERSRAVLAGLMVNGHNLLVLDEPTNHLDIPSAERLEESLRRYTSLTKKYSTTGQGGTEGTLILISHDRMLLDALVDQLLVFDGHGNATLFQGNYSDWLADHAKQVAAAAEAQAAKEARAAKQAAKPTPGPSAPPRREEPTKQKKPAGLPRKGAASKMSQDKLDARIAELNKAIQQHDFDLMNPDIFRDGEKVRQLQQQRTAMQDELITLEEEWLAREA